MRIHIVGASGSGKTWLSQKLSEKYGIPAYELDDLFWDDSKSGYSVKREEEERDRMFHDIVFRESWIIEGVQHAWVGESFESADVIYCLETPPALCHFRIVKRFLVRKWNHTCREKEDLQSLLRLLKWTRKFYRVNFPEIRNILVRYENKVVFLRSEAQMRSILE